jgi:TPR repeat protein
MSSQPVSPSASPPVSGKKIQKSVTSLPDTNHDSPTGSKLSPNLGAQQRELARKSPSPSPSPSLKPQLSPPPQVDEGFDRYGPERGYQDRYSPQPSPRGEYGYDEPKDQDYPPQGAGHDAGHGQHPPSASYGGYGPPSPRGYPPADGPRSPGHSVNNHPGEYGQPPQHQRYMDDRGLKAGPPAQYYGGSRGPSPHPSYTDERHMNAPPYQNYDGERTPPPPPQGYEQQHGYGRPGDYGQDYPPQGSPPPQGYEPKHGYGRPGDYGQDYPSQGPPPPQGYEQQHGYGRPGDYGQDYPSQGPPPPQGYGPQKGYGGPGGYGQGYPPQGPPPPQGYGPQQGYGRPGDYGQDYPHQGPPPPPPPQGYGPQQGYGGPGGYNPNATYDRQHHYEGAPNNYTGGAVYGGYPEAGHQGYMPHAAYGHEGGQYAPNYSHGPQDHRMHSPPPPPPQQQQQQTKPAVTNSAVLPGTEDMPLERRVDLYRQNAKRSNDPKVQLDFAKYLIEIVPQVMERYRDPKEAQRAKESLHAEALKWIKRLASQGMGLGRPAYPEAQFFLANCYGNGSLGLSIDVEKAFNLYLQASKQNHAAATYRAAVCYELGAGTKRDPNRAVQFYRKAAALGEKAAMYKLGVIQLNGMLNQQRNPREAITWLKRAAAVADEENPHALHELGLCYEKNTIPTIIPDEAYARELFTQAAQLGYAPSQFKLGCCYEYGTLTCPVDPRRSIAWYTRAAEQGDPEAELALSGWYLTGSEGVLKQSDTEAYLWARKAADKGLAKAEYAVGYYSEVGIGVKQDLEEARRWYLRAAAQGNKRAMQRLTELKKLGAGAAGRRPGGPVVPTRGQGGIKDENCSIM